MPDESAFERLFTAFTRNVGVERLALIVARGESFVDALPPDTRAEVAAMLTATWRDRQVIRAATLPLARMAVLKRRPDFAPVLKAPDGEAWFRRELESLRALVAEASRAG